MPTLFFIHIRKTGGTSVMHAARAHFGRERTLLVYGPNSQWTSAAAAEIMAASRGEPERRLALLADRIEQHDIAFYSSHISAAGLRCFDPARAFTILRDPVERVLSQYYFMRAKERTRARLEDFIERPEHRNEQARMLRGVDLEALGAVGVLERFDRFIEDVNDRFAVNFSIAHRKDGGVLKDMRAKLVRPSLRERIAALNCEDARLHRQAAAIVERRSGAAATGFRSSCAPV